MSSLSPDKMVLVEEGRRFRWLVSIDMIQYIFQFSQLGFLLGFLNMSFSSLRSVTTHSTQNPNDPESIRKLFLFLHQFCFHTTSSRSLDEFSKRDVLNLYQQDIVSVLSSFSRTSRQAIYILSGRGYVSRATLLSIPSQENLTCVVGV